MWKTPWFTGVLLFFYVMCNLAAVLTHTAMDPTSTAPMIVASGAMCGAILAYLILNPKARTLSLVFRFFIHIPACVLLGVWIASQVMNLSMVDGGGGVAWWAHIGGLVAGCILIFSMRHKSVPLFRRPSPTDNTPETGPHEPWGRLTLCLAKDHKKRQFFIPATGHK